MESKKNTDKSICIVGSGLVGTMLSVFLGKAGYKVDVYEKRSDPRVENITRGRTIGLSLSKRGWDALSKIGLEEVIRANTKATNSRAVHIGSCVHNQNYGDGKQAIWTINRNFLNTTLLDTAQRTNSVNLYFNHTFKELDELTGEITFEDSVSNNSIVRKYDHIIAADGAFSSVRRFLEKKGIWKFDENVLDLKFKEFSFCEDAEGKNLSPDNVVHVWPRKDSVLVTLPTHDGKFVSTLFFQTKGEVSVETLNCPSKYKAFFENECPDAAKYMTKIVEDFDNNPVSDLMQVKGGPWNYEDKVMLIGDACHSTTPFYAMGMNTGFEDCTVFMDLLQGNDFDIGKTIRQFTGARKPDADSMVNMSFENFKSLKESPDINFENKWILERRIWKLLPTLWTPVYVLISLSNTPFREIPAIKKRQNLILDKLISNNPEAVSLSDEDLKEQVLALMSCEQTKSSELAFV